jgi:hypothetical protein
MSDIEQLAQEHWDYLKTVLEQQLEVTGKFYRDAMVHGYRHGYEDAIKDTR